MPIAHRTHAFLPCPCSSCPTGQVQSNRNKLPNFQSPKYQHLTKIISLQSREHCDMKPRNLGSACKARVSDGQDLLSNPEVGRGASSDCDHAVPNKHTHTHTYTHAETKGKSSRGSSTPHPKSHLNSPRASAKWPQHFFFGFGKVNLPTGEV